MNKLSNDYVHQLCLNAKKASKISSLVSLEIKNLVLENFAELIISNTSKILECNEMDLTNANKKKLDKAKIDRITLDQSKIKGFINSINEIIKLEDPVGKILSQFTLKNGLTIKKVSIPIGVLFAIFEARPNVALDISALAFKSGNSVIMRSSSDCINSASIIISIFQQALEKYNLNQNIISIVSNPDYNIVNQFLKMNNFIDVVIPRGGKNLIKAIMDNTSIPLFNHLEGNCHTYIHQDADFEKARKITFNAKMRRTSICGATETLLIDQKIAKKILPIIADDLINANCELRGDSQCCEIDSRITLASDDDYYQEFLDKILAIKIVLNDDEAIQHIEKYGSSHTESIITENLQIANKFLREVKSAIVMHNASTQFADGYEFGMGAEVGIATGKLHARGPIGLEQLNTFNYQVSANCAIRS